MVNRVILIGNLGRDPEVRRLENGAVVAKFPIATNENYMDKKSGEWQQQTEWHDIVVWRTLAERAESSLKKGAMVYVEGKLTHRTWQDQDGNNRRTTEVVASYFRMMPSSGGGGSRGSNNYMPSADNEPAFSPASNENTSSPSPKTEESNTVTPDAGDDDLPF